MPLALVNCRSRLHRTVSFVFFVRMNNPPAKFAEALACIESMPVDDQTALLEIVNKRIASARRREMIQEIAQARTDFAAGKVKRGSAASLMRELRAT